MRGVIFSVFGGLLLLGTCWAGLVSTPVNVEPYFEQYASFDLDGDGGDDLQLRGSNAEVGEGASASASAYVGATGVDGVEFLVSESNRWLVEPLVEGSFIGAEPVSGVWELPRFRSVSVSEHSDANSAGFAPYLDGLDFVAIGFRMLDSNSGGYRYGWLDIRLEGEFPGDPFRRYSVPAFTRISYETEVDVPVVVGVIPEPSVAVLLLFTAIGLLPLRKR